MDPTLTLFGRALLALADSLPPVGEEGVLGATPLDSLGEAPPSKWSIEPHERRGLDRAQFGLGSGRWGLWVPRPLPGNPLFGGWLCLRKEVAAAAGLTQPEG